MGEHSHYFKKKRAQQLLAEGYSFIVISELTGVTEKTVREWADKYGWSDAMEQSLYGNAKFNSAVDFVNYVQQQHPDNYEIVDRLFKQYVNDLAK